MALDTETTSETRARDRSPVGLSICLPDETCQYFPWAHRGGGNLDSGSVRRWAQNELRGKRIYMLNAKYDFEMLRGWGVDLETQDCQLRDVAHTAALLDDHRRRFSLQILSQDWLGQEKIDPEIAKEIYLMPAEMVAPRAEQDARLTWRLGRAMAGELKSQDLERVQALEDDLIFPTIEMERNAAPIDVEKLRRWGREVKEEYTARIMKIWKLTGLRISPRSSKDLQKLFAALGILSPCQTAGGVSSFTEEVLESIDHPAVRLVLEAGQLESLNSKYLKKYLRALRNGFLDFQLHQLRGDEYGTVSGRYSSANINIQQVKKPNKQEEITQAWLIRELFIPAAGKIWMSADANQIEFRIFAHYAGAKKLQTAYRDNPDTDIHAWTADLTGLQRDLAKNVNFARMFGAGFDKICSMMTHLKTERVREILETYDDRFPEVQRLTARCSRTAQRRGFVRTILGRRARFSEGDRFYSAMNRIIQGSAADVLKTKLIELYRARKTLGLTMRFPVHDEINGDLDDPGKLSLVKELLNEQSIPLSVPLTWDVGSGQNWKEAK